MKMLKIGNIEISNLCLGGGKMVGMDFNIGRSLVNKALDLSINLSISLRGVEL